MANLDALLALLSMLFTLPLLGLGAPRSWLVGGNTGWTNFDPTSNQPPDYQSWSESHQIPAGDDVEFKYAAGVHDVFLFPGEASYTNCDFSTGKLLDDGSSGSFTWVAGKPGVYYFGCSRGEEGLSHCQGGQKVAISVLAAPKASSPPPPPPPPPSHPPPRPLVASPSPLSLPSPALSPSLQTPTAAPSVSPSPSPSPLFTSSPSPTPVLHSQPSSSPSPSLLPAPIPSTPASSSPNSSPPLSTAPTAPQHPPEGASSSSGITAGSNFLGAIAFASLVVGLTL